MAGGVAAPAPQLRVSANCICGDSRAPTLYALSFPAPFVFRAGRSSFPNHCQTIGNYRNKSKCNAGGARRFAAPLFCAKRDYSARGIAVGDCWECVEIKVNLGIKKKSLRSDGAVVNRQLIHETRLSRHLANEWTGYEFAAQSPAYNSGHSAKCRLAGGFAYSNKNRRARQRQGFQASEGGILRD